MKYILIIYVYDCNTILAGLMMNRSSDGDIKVHKKIYNYLEL